jgi:hypothetical protein
VTPETINGLYAIGGAVVGAVVAACLTAYFSARSEKKRILGAFFSPYSKLVQVSAQIASKITIHVEGEPVEDLYATELTILNLGNVAIKNINLTVDLGEEQSVVTFDVDENAKKNIGVQVILPARTNGFDVEVPFLNPQDELHLRFYVTSREHVPKAMFRQADVEFRTGMRERSLISTVAAEVILAAIQRNVILDGFFRLAFPVYRSYRKEKEGKKS